MVPAVWISLALLLPSGISKIHEKQVRHQRTRYLAPGSHFFGNESRPDGDYPKESTPSRPGSRLLFRWDNPTSDSSAAAPVNYRGDVSAVQPTVSRARKKPKSPIRRVKAGVKTENLHSNSISFRKSYVFKAIPTEDTKPPLRSRKIVYVVSKSARRLPGRPKFGRRGKHCKESRCSETKNETLRLKVSKKRYRGSEPSRSVHHFPGGSAAERQKELMPVSKNKWRKAAGGVGGGGGVSEAEAEQRKTTFGLCTNSPEKCDQICTEEDGRARCSCYAGFRLTNGTKCVDIDECRFGNGGCEGICVNTVGSRRCRCPEGFRLSPSGIGCLDVNECLLRNGHGPCQDTCVNTRGGYFCTCEGLKGTVLSRNNHTCEEISDCNTGAAGCSHNCISTFGRSFCTCPDGYELSDDWKTCRDIDECSDENVHCEFGCVNTLGSYHCEVENSLTRS